MIASLFHNYYKQLEENVKDVEDQIYQQLRDALYKLQVISSRKVCIPGNFSVTTSEKLYPF